MTCFMFLRQEKHNRDNLSSYPKVKYRYALVLASLFFCALESLNINFKYCWTKICYKGSRKLKLAYNKRTTAPTVNRQANSPMVSYALIRNKPKILPFPIFTMCCIHMHQLDSIYAFSEIRKLTSTMEHYSSISSLI